MSKEQFIQEFYLRFVGNFQKDSECIDRAVIAWKMINDKIKEDCGIKTTFDESPTTYSPYEHPVDAF